MKLFNLFGKKEQSLEDTVKELVALSEEEREKKLEAVTENKEDLLNAIADILNKSDGDNENDDDIESLIDTLKGKFTVEELKKIASEIELPEDAGEVDIDKLKEDQLADLIATNKPKDELGELLGLGSGDDPDGDSEDAGGSEDESEEDEMTNEEIEDAEQKKERYDQLIDRANKELKDGDVEAAIATATQAQDIGTGEADGAELISEIREKQEEDYNICEEFCLELEEEGEFKKVVKAWAKFAESAPDTPWAEKANARLAVVQGVINATTKNKTAGRKPTPIDREELKEDMQNLIIKLTQYTLQLRDDRKSGIATFNRAKRDLIKVVRITFR